jgi:hypothetical protein
MFNIKVYPYNIVFSTCQFSFLSGYCILNVYVHFSRASYLHTTFSQLQQTYSFSTLI